MSKPRVLICAHPTKGVIWTKAEQGSTLGQVADVIASGPMWPLELELTSQELQSTSRAEFIEHCKSGGPYDGVIGIYHHNKSSSAIGDFDEELIRALPDSLKYISHVGAGYDMIDVEACTARGIRLSNTPGSVDDATATVGAWLTISAMRQFSFAEREARAGKWKNTTSPARDPEGKTVGIIGMGGIGKAMARRLLAFDMKIIYHNRREINPAPDFPCTFCSTMEELLGQADVVSLNLPLTEETKGSFGKKQFEQMKDGSYLVNTARGAIVDEAALVDALKSEKLAGAGLDVFAEEPKIHPGLLELRNVTILPHMGTETSDSQRKLQVLDNLASAVAGKGLLDPVPEQRDMTD